MKTLSLLLILIKSTFAIDFPEETKEHVASSKKIMISSQGKESSLAGLKIYQQGGNITDVFVAVSFAISVERPQSTGLGGGGFALLKLKNQKTLAYDFRESAPSKFHEKIFQDKRGNVIESKSKDGPFAVGVPGLVKGLWEIHQKHGKLPWASLLVPAIEMASQGIEVYPHLHEAMKRRQEVLKKDLETRKIFLKPDGSVYNVGEKLLQLELASTLRRIATKGYRPLYHGRLSFQIAGSVSEKGGVMSIDDLKNYQVKLRNPVSDKIFGHQIISMPPPSSGGIHVIQILKLLEGDKKIKFHKKNEHYYEQFIRAMGFAFQDRAKFLGDPDFVKVDNEKLISKKHLAPFYLDQKKRTLSKGIIPKESTETTHFTIMDGEGNVISSTQTINGYFGAGFVAGNTGIVLNNEMDDFSAKSGNLNMFGAIGGDKNKVEAGKRPLSSMSPTIVLKGDKVVFALGTPNGTRIITCVANTLLNKLAFHMSTKEAVYAPRIHYQLLPDEVFYEEGALESSLIKKLEKKGYKFSNKPTGCKIQAISFEKNILTGVSDPRGAGASIGL